MKKNGFSKLDIRWLYARVILDLKPILVMINKGNFKEYDKIIPKKNPLTSDIIPKYYKEKNYRGIVQYIKDETDDFIRVFQKLKREMPKLKNLMVYP
jgi:hypothetical protein